MHERENRDRRAAGKLVGRGWRTGRRIPAICFPVPLPTSEAEPGQSQDATVEPDDREAATAAVIADLPDIASLERDSDFTPFLREGVPESIQRLALRKLWRLDPTFAGLDGLVDYDDDFSDAALVVEGLKTAYKVGKGLLEEEPQVEPVVEEDAVQPVEQAEAPPSGDAEPPDRTTVDDGPVDPEISDDTV